MSNDQIVASEFGKITDNGTMFIYNRPQFVKRISTFKNQNIEITITKRGGSFTHQQRKYYFSVIVPELQKAFYYHGNQLSKSEVDYLLRERMLFKETYDPELDEWKREGHRLNNQESEVTFDMFKKFMEDCVIFAAVELDWAVPYPNEMLKVNDFTQSQILSINHK
jgi:hypothetical protein